MRLVVLLHFPHLSYFTNDFLSLQAKRRLELDIVDHQYSEPARTPRGRRAAFQMKSPKGF